MVFHRSSRSENETERDGIGRILMRHNDRKTVSDILLNNEADTVYYNTERFRWL